VLGLVSRHAEQNGAVKPTAAAMLCPMGDSPPAHLQPRNPPAPPLTGTEGSNPPPSGESGILAGEARCVASEARIHAPELSGYQVSVDPI
jgi:hypothetical protein